MFWPRDWRFCIACSRHWKDARQKTLWVGLANSQEHLQPKAMHLCSNIERWQLPGGGRWSDPFLFGCSMRILDLRSQILMILLQLLATFSNYIVRRHNIWRGSCLELEVMHFTTNLEAKEHQNLLKALGSKGMTPWQFLQHFRLSREPCTLQCFNLQSFDKDVFQWLMSLSNP